MFRQLVYNGKGCQIVPLFKALGILSSCLKMIMFSEAGNIWPRYASAVLAALRREWVALPVWVTWLVLATTNDQPDSE